MRSLSLLCVPCLLLAGAAAIGMGCESEEGEGSQASLGGSAGAAGGAGTAGVAGTAGEAGAAGQDGGAGEPRKVVLLYTSDEHSNVFASSPERDDWPMATAPGTGALKGGIARRAAILAAERASAKGAGIPTVTVSAGDNSMGTLAQVVRHTQSYEWRLMKRLGYDVTGLGNHDFDLGLENLAGAIQVAGDAAELPPIVASNIHFSADVADDLVEKHMSETPGDGAALHRYHVLETDSGLRIGFISYLGVDASMKAPFKAPIAFSEVAVSEFQADEPEKVLPHLYTDLQPIVDKLRNDEKADLVVALSHGGLAPEKPAVSEDDKVAANVTGIDVIISGHAHEHGSEPLVVHNETSGRDVIVLNGGEAGAFVGRIELTVPGNAIGPVTYDKSTQAHLPVDDKTVPAPEFVDDMEQAIEAMESDTSVAGVSPIAQLLSRASGSSVTNDPAVAGDLYFHELASTSYDLPGKRPLAFLTADAQQAMLDQLNLPVQIALQSSGVIRSDLLKGKTGAITLADAFRVVPLGFSPTDKSVGYPLVRLKVAAGALRALFDLGSGRGPVDSSYDMTGSGVTVEIDCTRAPVSGVAEVFDPAKGRVMKIWVDADHSDGYEQADTLVWDRDNQPSSVFGGPLIVVSTTTYIAQIMAAGGVPLFGMDDKPVKPAEAIIVRPGDGTELKELDAFFSYLMNAPGGTLPDTYDEASANASKRFKSFAFCP